MADVSKGVAARDAKRTDLFQILRDGVPRTRSELAAITGLARSTVAAHVDALIKVGLIRPAGEAASTGGRPSSQVALDPSVRVVLSVDVGASHVRIATADLAGNLLGRAEARIPVAEGPEAILGWAIEQGRELLDEAHAGADSLLAIGVGLPGPVEHATGRPIDPPIMPGWDRYDVPAKLGEAFDVPVLVDNDVNIMALGERALSWPDVEHLIYVKIATGIGSGVISGGYLQRGAQGIAGDIGHVFVARGGDVPCRCGNRGCLEAVASGPAIAAHLATLGHDVSTSREVVDLVRAGNTDAIQAVREAGRSLGEVLTACVSLMNPEVIVLGGAMAAAGEHLLAGAREVVYARSMPLATGNLQITPSRSGEDAALLGGAMLAIAHGLSPEGIDTLVAQL